MAALARCLARPWRLAAILACSAGVAMAVGSSVPAAEADRSDLALILAVDTSYSVDTAEYHQQMQGLADALRSPDVIAATHAGAAGNILVAVMHWSDMDRQDIAVPWTRISGAVSAGAFADRLEQVRRQNTGATSISGAIFASIRMFADLGPRAPRRVLDISTDGINNEGWRPEEARDQARSQGITINGLTIITDVPYLEVYFRHHVIVGSGSFVLKADGYRSYHDAIKRKLLREIMPPIA